MIHIYCGDGKGKTTAAIGLAVRAAGSGRQVVLLQFFKDGNSAEFHALGQLEHIQVIPQARSFGFIWTLSPQEKAEARDYYTGLLHRAMALSAEAGMLVLDEAMSACSTGTIDEAELLAFLRTVPAELEVVLTGRDPSPAMLEAADYVTEMRKVKHPFDQGVPARPGIEY